MIGATKNGWVWRSTAESREAGIVSVLAVVETLLAVTAFWWLLWQFGLTWHHGLFLLIAPLMLMRSEASIKKGAAWFDTFYNSTSWGRIARVQAALAVTGGILAGLVVASALDDYLFANYTGLSSAWRAVLAGWLIASIVVAGTIALSTPNGVTPTPLGAGSITALFASVVADASATATMTLAIFALGPLSTKLNEFRTVKSPTIMILVPVFYPLIALALALGVWLRVVGTRFLATALHPLAGLVAVPANWQHLIWSSDSCHPPELMPGHLKTRYDFSDLRSSWMTERTTRSVSELLMIAVPVLPFWYAPTLLWRWAIKSTAWFYVPLLWVGRGWLRLDDEDLLVWSRSYNRKLWNVVRLIRESLLLVISVASLILTDKFITLSRQLDVAGAPTMPFGLLLAIDWSELARQPWLWCYILAWLLIISLFLGVDDVVKELREGGKLASRMAKLRWWMWASNLRVVLTNLGLLITLWYFLDAVDAWERVQELVADLR